jgi:hypothetical protein
MVELIEHANGLRAAFARCGEVVAAQVSEFEAQCDELHEAPPLGALVRVNPAPDFTIYGLVAGISTGGVDAGMRPIPRGRDGCEDAAIFLAHPDLVHLLATSVRCLVVGFCQAGTMYRYLPSLPAPIHYSVTACTPTDVEAFTRDFGYFPMIISARDVPIEEVVAAHVRHAAGARNLTAPGAEPPYDFSVRAGRTLAQLLRGEPQRLSTVLQRIRQPQPTEPIPPVWEPGRAAQPAAHALAP